MTTEDEYRAAEAHVSSWDGWIDEPERDWSTLTMFLRALALLATCFCVGVLIGFAWSVPQ